MAKKIDVIGVSGQKESGQIKKCVAQLLVRRLFAVWVTKNECIRRLAIKAVQLAAPRHEAKPKPYIPEEMPPREVSGCKFIEPQTEIWRNQVANSAYRFRSIPLSEQTV